VITWQQIGGFQAPNYDYRIEHVGLSDNGKHCFMATDDNWKEWIWDIQRNEVIWFKDYSGADELLRPDLSEWITNGFYEPLSDPLHGKYRIIGLREDHPLLENSTYGVRIANITADGTTTATLELVDSKSGELMQLLEFADQSGDFAYATFTADGSILAAVTPYDVTFFALEVD
jgi:hypothetical protein